MSTTTATTTQFQTGVQYGFFFDESRCVGCHACELACKSWNQIPAGPLKPLRVNEWEEGAFPNVTEHFLAVPCYHCENPICVTESSAHALAKESKFGAVIIDPSKTTQVRDAAAVCPYGAIVFESDDPNAKAFKCTMCIDRLEQGLYPACVMACPMRAFDFGPLSQLQTKYGKNADLPGLPNSSMTTPAAVFKPQDPKKQIIPYDSNAALTLLAQRRTGLPPVFSQPSDATYIPDGLISRNQPVLKPANTQELLRVTKNDDA